MPSKPAPRRSIASDAEGALRTASPAGPQSVGDVSPDFTGTWPAAAVLVLLPLVTFIPVLQAGFIWDDHENVVTNQTLRSFDGLRQMWLVPESIQQYYPLMYTSYWLEYRLWGEHPLGYHVVNVLLHVAATLLFWRLLVVLRVPGAWLAAAIFAVHPVTVESVAWITERKNVLSLSLALASMLCYFRFRLPEEPADRAEPRAPVWPWYVAALGLFAFALFAKTVVVTLPPVLLVIGWWKRGRIAGRDVVPLIPFFAVAFGSGLMTMWMETVHLGATGAAWNRSPVERLLLAGRALWFYAGKLVWPHPLAFFYPHWRVDVGVWWQYLFVVAAIAFPAALWMSRRQCGRGPLAAVLIYTGVLMPMLGFFNIYFAMYAYVSDHFQYHACLALIALAAAGITRAAERFVPRAQGERRACAAVALCLLAVVSFRQAFIYRDLETLYRDTIAKNPRGVISYSNLGVHLGSLGRHRESVELARAALAIDPQDPLVHQNLGFFLLNLGSREGFQPGQLEEIVEHLRQAIGLSLASWGSIPAEAKVRAYLGAALLQLGERDGLPPAQREEMLENLSRAVELDPANGDVHTNLALALVQKQRLAEAMAHFSRAVEIDPNNNVARCGMGSVLTASGQPAAARACFADALARDARCAPAHYGLALVELQDRQTDAARKNLLAAIEIDPRRADAHYALGGLLAGEGDLAGAQAAYRRAVAVRPNFARAWNNLGVVQMNAGATAEALDSFRQAIAHDAQYAEARENLRKAEQPQQEPTSALQK